MEGQAKIDPIKAKQNRVDILESLRTLSPASIAQLAQAANRLVQDEKAEEAVDA